MTLITATSEKTAQSLAAWRSYNGNYWWAVRAVGWITQDSTTLQTHLYYKWQIGSYNYWPYNEESHEYIISGNGARSAVNFKLNQDRSNTYIDKTPAQKLTFGHNATTGACSITLRFQGYKCFEYFDYSENFEFPTIAIPEPSPTPSPEQEESLPFINDTDPKFYIYADDEILYMLSDEQFYIANPKLTLELNQIDSLDFTIPCTHPSYHSLSKLKTTIEVVQGTETLFRGRVLDDDIDFYNQKKVHCEGALGFLNDTIMPPYEIGTYSTVKDLFKAALDQHTSQVPDNFPERRIKYVKCDVNDEIEAEDLEYSQTMSVVSNLVSDNGGYLKLEYYDNGETGLSYFSSAAHTTKQVIDFGENLLDLTQSIDASDIYTSVVCLGAADEETGERLTTGSGSDIYIEDKDAIKTYGRIIRIFTYDDIDDVDELRAIANTLLVLGMQQSVTFTVKALDLHLIFPEIEKIRIGDSVRIRSIPHNLDSYFQCSRIEMDLQSPDNTEYTFGATIKALTDTTSKQ